MTTTDLDDRLARLATHLDAERDRRTTAQQLAAGQAGPSGPSHPSARTRTTARGRPMLAVAAALVVALAAAGLAIGLRPPVDGLETAATVTPPPPSPVPADAPPPGSVAPYVAEPPSWFGEPGAAERVAGHHRGAWVSMAIGIEDGDGGVGSPIRIGVTGDGSLRDLDTAPVVRFDDRDLRLLTYGTAWQALATTDQPTIVVSGAVDVDLLAEVLRATRLHVDGSELNIELITLPAGYSTVVAPQRQATDVANRRTFAGSTGDIVINEVSEWVRADLAAAATGADFRSISIGQGTGYTGTATSTGPGGPITFLIWSPQPGVVLEIDTTNRSLRVEQLAELAARVAVVPVDRWDRSFDDPSG